jgi:GDPmannose 4,6-dehydratase
VKSEIVKTALILGIDGQDGSYLAEFLLDKGYKVVGWIPTTIPVSLGKIAHILDKVTLRKGDLQDQHSLNNCLDEFRPDEIYNLASPSFPAASWNAAVQVGEVVALGVSRLLEAIRLVCPEARFFQASSSELFGDPVESPQKESTPFSPRNPYGIAKAYAHWATVNYRRKYGLFAVSGIMFNHESPRRPVEFIPRKVSWNLASIKAGRTPALCMGDLSACRDWGYAPDYIEAMWRMLQCPEPEDFVIGTGEAHPVREYVELAFGYLGLDWQEYVRFDQSFYRRCETNILRADPSKARRLLEWEPRIKFEDLVRIMVDADMHALGLTSPGEGARLVETRFGKWHNWQDQIKSMGA